jgi:hypothetical protein
MASYKLETAVGFAVATLGVITYMQIERQRALIAQQRQYIEQQHRALVAQISQIFPIREDQAASALHAKAWGKLWPQSKGTISKIEISGESGSVDDDDDDDDDVVEALADKLKVPQTSITCTSKKYRALKALSAQVVDWTLRTF